jgi:hypothetical protein
MSPIVARAGAKLQAFSKAFMTLLTCALVAITLVAPVASPAQAAGGTGTWGKWALSGSSGTLDLSVGGFTSPSGSFTTNGTRLSSPSGANTWLNGATDPGAQFGTSRNSNYLQIGTVSGGGPSTTTITFDNATPSSGWGFVLGDIDADKVAISATDAAGNPVAVAPWFQNTFNYCNGMSPAPCSGDTDTPSWNSTDTLTGSGSDTDGASAWFRPTTSIKTLTFTFSRLSGFPVYQIWFAGDTPASENYKITMAARACQNYTDIMANKARNNIMESLNDLGVNSLYSQTAYAGPVRPEVETLSATGQDGCTSLTNWSFATGTGISGKDNGTFGSLSKVSGSSTVLTTKAQTPQLDSLGNPSGSNIAGAVTYNLTASQITEASQRRFWIQGGVPGNPLNGLSAQYAFGTLRCANDNANADNVEWAGYTGTSRHVFCYAYYVSASPVQGKIIVRKTMPSGSPSATFSFGGDLSFTDNGSFNLAAGASQTFTRAAGETWTIFENSPTAPFAYDSLNCTSAGGSTYTYTSASRKVEVALAANDTVTCTFANKYDPQSQLEVYKVTKGGTGSFLFNMDGHDVSRVTVDQADTEVPVYAADGLTSGSDVVLKETNKSSEPGGSWTDAQTDCWAVDGKDNEITAPVVTGMPDSAGGSTVTLNSTHGSKNVCTITNTFVPDAKVKVRSQILGGSAATSVESSYSLNNPLRSVDAVNTLRNTSWGPTGQDEASTTGLDFGQYTLQGIAPENTPDKTWTLDSVVCSGGVDPLVEDATVTFALDNSSNTAAEIDCTYYYRITNLVNVTINKVSVGAVGTFTLAASYLDGTDEGVVTTTAEDQAVTALTLDAVPEGTDITLAEMDLPTSDTGAWNATTTGEPTWKCEDTAGDPVAIAAGGVITTGSLNIDCTAKNVFTDDVTRDATGDGVAVMDKGLPAAGGSWLDVICEFGRSIATTISNLLN